jgi:hypothetical protein
MTSRTGFLVALGLLAASISTAAAGDGTMPYDTLACRDKSSLMAFADQMLKSTANQFTNYVNEITNSGQCEKILQGEQVTFVELSDGGICLSLRTNEPCFWTIARPVVGAAAVAARAPTTTGQGVRQAPPVVTSGQTPPRIGAPITRAAPVAPGRGQMPAAGSEITGSTR